MHHADVEQPLPRVFIRTRDLCMIAGFMVGGGGLLYTALLRGAPPSGKIAVAAFIFSAIIMVAGFIGGLLVDQLGRRHPFLVKERFNHTMFFILTPVLVFTLLAGWSQRDRVFDGLKDTGQKILWQAEARMEEIGVP